MFFVVLTFTPATIFHPQTTPFYALRHLTHAIICSLSNRCGETNNERRDKDLQARKRVCSAACKHASIFARIGSAHSTAGL